LKKWVLLILCFLIVGSIAFFFMFFGCGFIAGTVRDPLELSEEEWNHVIRTNTTGTWLVSKAVCIRMRDSKRGGSVINIASIAGLNRGQLPGGIHYVASKTGVNAISKVMYVMCDLRTLANSF
jgi:NAD(P)-dependent dehydrogenase (short-subunit alcohol dehydrogenase family)